MFSTTSVFGWAFLFWLYDDWITFQGFALVLMAQNPLLVFVFFCASEHPLNFKH